MDFNSSTTYQIPAGTYSGGQGSPAITILNAGGALAGSITTAACGGGGNTGDITISAPLDTTVSNYNITLAASVGDLTLNSATAAVGVHGSTVMVPGNVTISNVNAYINLGSSTWTIGGTWSNSSTVAQWNSGTSSITFTSPSGWTYTQNLSVTQPEFYSVTFASSNAGAAQTFPAGTNTTFGGTLTITGQNATATTTFDLSASNLSLTSTSIVINANGILNGRGSTVTVNGTFDPHAGTYTSGTSTVVLGATGNLDYSGAQAGVRKLWNLTINAGVTTTYQGNIGLHNRFTISGRLVASVDPASNFFMVAGEMVTDGLPVVFNSGADLSQSGFFDYRYEGGVSWTVVGTTYQMIGIEGGAVGFPETANFGGDISTPICGVYNLCEMIMNPEGPTLAGTDPPILTVNTNGHNVTLGGTLFLGDGPGFGVKFNAGSSTISAFGVSVNGNTIANFQSATINAHPSSTYNPVALYLVDTATLNGGGSTINNHGQLRLWVTSSVGLFSQSSTINVFADEGGCNVQLSGCPGDVAILAAGDFIDFGSSTWNVYGVSDNDWNSSSMSPLWSATPAATVNFLGIGNVQIGNNGNNFPLLNLRSSGSVQFLQSFGSYDTTIAPSVSTVLFTTGITWNFYGTRLTGPPGQKVTLKPTTGGAWYFISKSGTVNANNLDVQWSDASAGPQVQAQSNVRDSGSNLNWFFASPSPTPGCTGNQCGPLMSCNTTYVPLGFSISCSTLVPSTASTPIWYVNGSRVGIGPRLNTFVASFGFAQTVQVTLFFVTIDPTSQTASSTQYLTLNSSANVLVYIGLLLLGIVFVTSRDPRKKGAWIGFDVHNLAHRHLAISVGENPRGWRSYRQRPRGVFRPGSLRGRVFYSSTYGTDLWVIRGRLKTNGNWATQTVRERIKR